MARIRKKIQSVPRSPRMSSGIRLEGASSTVNQELLVSGEHYPDRTMVPLVLQPFCSYTDATTGLKVENAMPEVTDGQWYRLTDANRHLGLCEATKISPSATGTASDGSQITLFSIVSTPGAANYGRLTVRENVAAGESITYWFEGKLSSTGQVMRESFDSKCVALTEFPDILFDNNPSALYDPIHDTQYFSCNPSLSIDYPVVWSWESYHELDYEGWGALGGTQLDWAVDQVGDGIKIDRKVMPEHIVLRCIAMVTIDGVTIRLEKPFTHTRVMPHFEADIIRVGEMTEDVTSFCPYALIKVGDFEVPDTSEFIVRWYNSSDILIAEGINPTIPVSKLNADRIYDLEVLDRGAWKLLISEGKLVTSNGDLIRVRTKL